MKIIFFGDIVGRAGIEAVRESLDFLKGNFNPDFLICNGENVSNGKGIIEKDYDELVSLGINCITLGNHYRSKQQIDKFIDKAALLVRPLNLNSYSKGEGSRVFEVNGTKVRVSNVLGSAFMNEVVPSAIDYIEEIVNLGDRCIHIVDFHAESSSEKRIFATFFDGKVSAVIGTHTHVQTNDNLILKGGTGFITDVGLCGAADSIIGFNNKSCIDKTIYGVGHMVVEDEGPRIINCVYLEIDEDSKQTKEIKKIKLVNGREIKDESLHL